METDVVIAVMGMTGVGKSTFIKNITGCQDIIIGHGLTSETSDVKGYTFSSNNIHYTLVDTPGFNDTFESDQVITEKILEWLESSYRAGMRLNGILYLHSIALPKMQGSAFENLCMFKKLCGDNTLSHVVMGTTFWNHTELAVGEKRERELTQDNRFWGRMMKEGSRILRLKDDATSALEALVEVSKGSKVTLQAQNEMVEEGKTVEQTTAAQFVASCTRDSRGSWQSEVLQKQRDEARKRMEKLEEMRAQLDSGDEILSKVRKQAEEERAR
ncbi:hypothetical protein K505DRAFT_195785, partial [Melanomma pulvis-pyrius CBS 109.77]